MSERSREDGYIPSLVDCQDLCQATDGCLFFEYRLANYDILPSCLRYHTVFDSDENSDEKMPKYETGVVFGPKYCNAEGVYLNI